MTSEDTPFRDSANVPGASSSEVLRRRRNRPRSKNRAAYARHHQISREEGEISPIAEESLKNTLLEVVQTVSGPVVRAITPEISGTSRGQALLKRRWLVKPPSQTRFEDLSVTQNCSSDSVDRQTLNLARGKLPVEDVLVSPLVDGTRSGKRFLVEQSVAPTCSKRPVRGPSGGPSGTLDSPLDRSVPVKHGISRIRPRSEVGQSSEDQANLSSEFSLESSRLFKRHMKYAARVKSTPRSWDLNSNIQFQHAPIEDSLI